MSSQAFVGGFDDVASIVSNFEGAAEKDLAGATIHLAWYGYGSYDGEATVIYERDGKLYEVNGSHCSCNGLEGQWSPEETTWEALAHVVREGHKFSSNYSSDEEKALARLHALVDERVPVPSPSAS